jgi:hypothetical protein
MLLREAGGGADSFGFATTANDLWSIYNADVGNYIEFTKAGNINFRATSYTFDTGAAVPFATALLDPFLVEQVLEDAETIIYNTALGRNATLTLVNDRTLAIPTNAAPGSSGRLVILQDTTGGRALTLATGWGLTTANLASVAAMASSKKCVLSWTRVTSTTFASTLIFIP